MSLLLALAGAPVGTPVTLAATEGADTLSATVEQGGVAALAATEGADVAAFEFDVEGATARKGGVGSKRRVSVVDVIWPDDPRHPNYIAPLADKDEPEPKPILSNVIRVPKVAARRAVETPEAREPRRYDAELALLLLAA